ncbi:MAG: heat-inducible transcription repressor HrcA [Lachnospiraceae bacterium]|nr:heat-inducible transcription repressor HrcA [Lachnospiraceae bacterium]
MKILQAVVRNYLETGEPVGSRTISKYTDLNLSSATIRNEMSDLEDMGLIKQPHTSAGRIPTDAGYRMYVDNMLSEGQKEVEDMKSLLLDREERLENMLQQVAKMLASNTNYASMISAPVVQGNKIKFIQLSQVDERNILAVIVLEGNLVRNTMIPVDKDLGQETLLMLNMLLNTSLNGLAVEQVNLGLIAAIKKKAGAYSELVEEVIDAAAEAIKPDEDLKIYTSGATNIFRYPELADHQKARDILLEIEEKGALGTIVQESLSSGETGIQVYIGGESQVESMKDCSVVTTTYDLGDGMKGTVGIIGPKRMDYDKVVGVLKDIARGLDDLYKNE